MSSTLFRFGLYLVVAVLAVFIARDNIAPIQQYVSDQLLQHMLLAAGAMIVVGVVLKMFEKTAKVVTKNRCAVCRTPITAGAIYCRAHLRSILADEDDRTHRTRPGF